ncbi:MAG: GxxExxY protein [Verrucomicrobia bacterium]|nr:MAG: GxxExxY protein [Verrucomicrobiota bacterium]PYJ99651.1 MAG: GxxExxY protein [Verrucomicrobiota bacterium]PYL69651.1 MAG: GxxExxY protein [Verrucomicrobiota bacterium]
MEFDELSQNVIGCAIEVHRNLGPGLLESTYRQCLACELSHVRIPFQMELPLPVRYKDLLLDCGYRIDLLVRSDLIVEIKSVETLLPIHQAQILTYLRLSKVSLGLLIDFNVTKLQNGIKRFVL